MSSLHEMLIPWKIFQHRTFLSFPFSNSLPFSTPFRWLGCGGILLVLVFRTTATTLRRTTGLIITITRSVYGGLCCRWHSVLDSNGIIVAEDARTLPLAKTQLASHNQTTAFITSIHTSSREISYSSFDMDTTSDWKLFCPKAFCKYRAATERTAEDGISTEETIYLLCATITC